jgi:hypothetical protein
MSEDDKVKFVKEPLHCPACSLEITYVQDVQNPQPLQKGMILVCGECGVPCELGDSDLRKLTKEDIAALDPQSRSTLFMLSASVMQKRMVDKATGRNN